MTQFELLLPKMGESVAEATIVKWLKGPGDTVKEDDAVLEVATDKVDSEVPSPVDGTIVRLLFKEDDVVQVGMALAIIETNAAAPADPAPATSRPVQEEKPQAAAGEDPAVPGMDQLSARKAPEPESIRQAASRFYSPLVRSIATEEGLSMSELESIPGSGSEGRVTREDILAFVRSRQHGGARQPEPAAVRQPEPQPAPVPEYRSEPLAPIREQRPEPPRQPKPGPPEMPLTPRSSGDEIIEMDRMRKIIAEHMVMSAQTSPHVSSFVEADVTNLVKWRDRVKGMFEKREGEKLTFTPIFVEAVAKAIRDMPMINVSVEGTRIIKKRDINIGLAAALPSGNLIVPVIKKADQLNLVGLSKAVNDLANRARTNKLQPDEIKDGTFTITNIGTFGNIMGTPIINQPQVAILAIGIIKKKPAVIETEHGDVIGIRHMTYLSMSYDHRVVDGALGGSFLKRVADYLEAWDSDRVI
jgi:2-oxoglutarate dehydrogenase E2 component (dihydrolipoamide succinyltransferase)